MMEEDKEEYCGNCGREGADEYKDCSPHYALEDMRDDGALYVCGYRCDICNRFFCNDCCECVGCRKPGCPDCDQCSICGDHFCPECLKKCEVCNRRVCSACLTKTGGKMMCNACVELK